jgi:DNA-binding winged helix-turn-helix (wHTH) protein/TolB-like protein
MPEAATYRFGVFEFNTATHELRRNGTFIAIEPQPARALSLLLERAGELVTRDELKEAVWGRDTHVDFDRGLAYAMSQVRGALGDNADNPRFVQTLPRRGYKFIAPVHVASDMHTPAELTSAASTPPAVVATPRPTWGWVAAAVAALVITSWGVWRQVNAAPTAVIAVSIFDNETGLSEHDRLVAGLSDVVVTRLTQMAPNRVAVIGNAQVLRQPRNIRNLSAIRAEVAADYVLLGQLQRAEPGLRFITHFIRLSDEAHLQANRLSFADGDLSRLESEVVTEFERAVPDHVLAAASRGR